MNCTLSPEVYRWQHNGGWLTGRLVSSDTDDDYVVTKYAGEESISDIHEDDEVLVFDPLAEAPGLSFVPWGQLELYERGP